MAWLAVDKNGSEYLYTKKPERIIHYNVFRPNEIDFEIWGSSSPYIILIPGSIKKLIGRELTWEDEPVEI